MHVVADHLEQVGRPDGVFDALSRRQLPHQADQATGWRQAEFGQELPAARAVRRGLGRAIGDHDDLFRRQAVPHIIVAHRGTIGHDASATPSHAALDGRRPRVFPWVGASLGDDRLPHAARPRGRASIGIGREGPAMDHIGPQPGNMSFQSPKRVRVQTPAPPSAVTETPAHCNSGSNGPLPASGRRGHRTPPAADRARAGSFAFRPPCVGATGQHAGFSWGPHQFLEPCYVLVGHFGKRELGLGPRRAAAPKSEARRGSRSSRAIAADQAAGSSVATSRPSRPSANSERLAAASAATMGSPAAIASKTATGAPAAQAAGPDRRPAAGHRPDRNSPPASPGPPIAAA